MSLKRACHMILIVFTMGKTSPEHFPKKQKKCLISQIECIKNNV